MRLLSSTNTLLLALVPILSTACGWSAAAQDRGMPRKGSWVLRGSTRVPAGEYVRPAGEEGAIVLRGLDDVVLDLEGVTLRGAEASGELDGYEGYGIVIDDCRDVRVRGGTIGGYRGCIVVTGSERVRVEGTRFEAWFGQRLRSNIAAEDPGDWLWPHDNDEGEWLEKYGAAISFTDCADVVVRQCRGRKGQNGVLLTRTNDSRVYDNDFSFLSGWGIALYRSSRNTISRNITDYCVRGYSHGVYSRGQDSAGILMFERCCDNVVAFNSATHSGDGIFLFAGRDLVDGKARERGDPEDPGGSDRNLFYGNDLRYSPANAWEGTFSNRNYVVKNDLSGCAQHGVWGGYSSELVVLDNVIDETDGAGITIEHGQDCVIAGNTFRRNNTAVEIYWDSDPQFVDGSYGELRDTSSRDSWIMDNDFEGNTQDLVLTMTTGVVLRGNDWDESERRPHVDRLFAAGEVKHEEETLLLWAQDREGKLPSGRFVDSSLAEWMGEGPALLENLSEAAPPEVPGRQDVRAEKRGVKTGDRETIVMSEWGPWDYRSGEPRPAAVLPGGVLADVRWDARWFRWTEDVDPRGDLAAWRALAAQPLVQKNVRNWIDPWGDDDVRAAVGADHFGLIAMTTVELAAGSYKLSVTSDDGVRVLVDGEEVFADWTWHAPRRGEAQLEFETGPHELTIEYFQIDGAQALLVELVPEGP